VSSADCGQPWRCPEQFVDLVRSSGLTGFEFRVLWSDEVSTVA
jgi:hypothetical protein